MKVLLSVFSINEQILHIRENLQSLGCNVRYIDTDPYRQTCSYFAKKIDEIGIQCGRHKYLEYVHNNLYKIMNEFQPDIVLFINIPKGVLTIEDLIYIKKRAKTVCWFVDGISNHPEIKGYLNAVDHIYVFEYKDVAYLNSMNFNGTYLPVGFNDAFMTTRGQENIDIIFIGSPFRNRLEILEKVAKTSKKKKWILKIIGPFYNDKYPWKKIIFKRKYPYIYSCLDNRRVSSKEAAELYSRTKICLNIHDCHHKSPNPRTFEILATGAFELIDKRDSWGGLEPGIDLIPFDNTTELISKIDYYLKNDTKRCTIARQGKQAVMNTFRMKYLLNKIISSI